MLAISSFPLLRRNIFIYNGRRWFILNLGLSLNVCYWHFGRKICAYDTEHLVVELDRHVYSKDYIELTKDFLFEYVDTFYALYLNGIGRDLVKIFNFFWIACVISCGLSAKVLCAYA